MNARSIGYIGDGHSGEVFLEIVDRLKLREPLAGKLVPFTGAYAGAAEASEQLQYVVAPFFKPLPEPLRLVGYFPASLNADVDVSAGASPKAVPAACEIYRVSAVAGGSRAVQRKGLPAGSVAKADDAGRCG